MLFIDCLNIYYVMRGFVVYNIPTSETEAEGYFEIPVLAEIALLAVVQRYMV